MANESAFLRMHYLIVALLQFAEHHCVLDVHGGHLVEGCQLVLHMADTSFTYHSGTLFPTQTHTCTEFKGRNQKHRDMLQKALEEITLGLGAI